MKDNLESEENSAGNKPAGIMGDLQNIKTNGLASLSELREFIGSLKGRKPKEFMGEVANNGLVQGTVISTIGFLVILLVFTAIPYYMAEKEPVVQKNEPAATTANEKQSKEEEKEKKEDTANDDTKSDESNGKTGDRVLDNLGIGETKKAATDKNPLGDKYNDLLKGVK